MKYGDQNPNCSGRIPAAVQPRGTSPTWILSKIPKRFSSRVFHLVLQYTVDAMPQNDKTIGDRPENIIISELP